jgi:hypothetical protein
MSQGNDLLQQAHGSAHNEFAVFVMHLKCGGVEVTVQCKAQP